ncbi:hypothetical protein Emag_002437 [Eimeria magna]
MAQDSGFALVDAQLPTDDTRPSLDGQEAEKEPEAGSSGCNVYVGNLAWSVRSAELQEHMSQAGEVVRADVFEDYQGRSKGCGVVTYKDEESAQRAIKELTDTLLQGGRGGYQGNHGGGYQGGQGNFQGSGSQGAGGRQVFVSNLPWKTSWHELKDLFRECGEVIRVEIMELPNGRSKGIGTVLFATHESAQHAIDTFNNYILDNRPISVRFDKKEF